MGYQKYQYFQILIKEGRFVDFEAELWDDNRFEENC